MRVDELATYEVVDVSHQVAEETQFGSDKFNTVMKTNEAYVTVAQTRRNEAYEKFNSPQQLQAEQLDTDNSIGMEVNEAYNTLSAEVGYATLT